MKIAAPFATAGLLLALTAGSAAAEIIVLRSGRILSVKGHRFDGHLIVLTLRSGGEVTWDRSLVSEVRPDEFRRPDPSRNGSAQTAAAALKSTPYGEIIAAVSEAHGVDPMLVRALIQVESNYRPRARSPKGAMGLMQLMPATAREYKVTQGGF